MKIETGRLTTKGFCNGAKIAIPFVRLHSKKAGPTIAVVAAQHGRELNGIESIRRAIAAIRKDDSLCGTCTFIPVANLMGCQTRKQDFPLEEARFFSNVPEFNMNRAWPGREDGELYERIAKVVWERAICCADICIDLHCWTERSTMLAWGVRHDADMVRAFGLPIHLIKDNADGGGNMLENVCRNNGIACITAELTPQHVLSPLAIEAGMRGILNVMKHVGMLAGTIERPAHQFESTDKHQEHVVKASQSGLLVPRLKVAAPVKKGDVIAEIVNLNNVLRSQVIRSPANGVLFNNGPVWSETIPPSSIIAAGESVALIREAELIVNKDEEMLP